MIGKKSCHVFIGLLMFIAIVIWSGGLNVEAASNQTKKVKGITYQVVSRKKKTATVVKASKAIKTARIVDTIKLKKKSYKVISISKNAFKNRKKLTSIVIGKNIKKISQGAFSKDKKLKKITIETKKLKEIGKNAFEGINKKAVFFVPDNQYKKYSKLIKNKKTGWKKSMKIKKLSKTIDEQDDESYTYTVNLLGDGSSGLFYVQTDNPDPESFEFVDKDSGSPYTTNYVYISQYPDEFADVNYTDKETMRVNGGYIFSSPTYTDGGEWNLVIYFNGERLITDITINAPAMKSSNQYLIGTYTDSSMTFFEKMDAIEKGLKEISLYSGVYVRGELQKSTSAPYYGLSNSPHIDQTFYIQSPYYSDSKSMLISALYPYRFDSLGFPAQLGIIAKLLDPSASYQWNPNWHWLIDVTCNGETRSYGGQGTGGGQGITEDLIKYRFSFDGSANDAYNIRSLKQISDIICEYGALNVPEEVKDLPELTWQQVSDTVGTEGSYVRLVLLHSVWGGSSYGYTFLYDNGVAYPGFFSNVWYDGRYFNSHEVFEKGTTFDNQSAATGDIVIKDAVIPFPEETEGKQYKYQYRDIDQLENYDADTGVWDGFTWYQYDPATQTWTTQIYTYSMCFDEATGQYSAIEDAAFKDACILTKDEVKAMGIDKNANIDPVSYYNYDKTVPPGTKVG